MTIQHDITAVPSADVTRSVFPASAKKLFVAATFGLWFGMMPVHVSAQNTETEEPITEDVIADAVESIGAIKQNPEALATYCKISSIQEMEEELAEKNADAAKALGNATDALVQGLAKSLGEDIGEDFVDAMEAQDELADDAPIGKPLFAALEDIDKNCDSEQ